MANVEPVKIEFLLRETIAEGLKEAKKAISDIDSGVKTGTDNFKDQIAKQRQLIREITGDIKQLKAAYEEATNPVKKADILGDLKGARKALAEEQAVLIELQGKQLEANKKEEESHGSLLSSLGKWAIGIVSVTGALELAKKIIESTEATADGFEKGIAAASSATSYFFKTIASGDWSNFLDGMGTAVKAAVDYVTAMEDVDNRMNEHQVKSAERQKQISLLRIGTFDKSKGNVEVNIENLKEIIRLQKEDYAEEQKIIEDKYKATVKQIAANNKMSEEKAAGLVTEYSASKKIVELGEEYNKAVAVPKNFQYSNGMYGTVTTANPEYDKAQKKLKEIAEEHSKLKEEISESIKNMVPDSKEFKSAQEQLRALGENTIQMGETSLKYSKLTKAEKKTISDLDAQQIKLSGQAVIGSRRDENQLAMRENAQMREQQRINDEKKKVLKDQIKYDIEIGRQRLENQLKIEQSLLDAQKDSAEKKRAQAELNYKKEILDIQNQYQERLKKYNEVNGGIDKKSGGKTSNYVDQLPEEDNKQRDALILAAEKKKNGEIQKINEAEAWRLKKLWDDVNDTRLTGLEKARAAMKEKYDKMAKDAQGNDELLKAIEVERGKTDQDLIAKFSFKNFKESIDWGAVFGDLDRVSTSSLNELREKLKKYLAGIGDSISQEDLKAVTEAFEKLNNAISNRTPIVELRNGYKEYKVACEEVTKAQEKYNQAVKNGSGKELSEATKILTKAQNERTDSLVKMNKAVNNIGKDGTQLVNAGRDVVNMLENLGVNVDERTKKILDGFGQTMEGLESIDITKPMSIVTGGIKAVTGTVNQFAAIFGGGSKELSQSVIENYNRLMSVMKDVISTHKELMAELSGKAAVSEGDKTVELINKQIEATRKLGLEFLSSRAAHSHSYGYKLKKDLDEYAKEFSRIGIDFSDSKGGIGQLFSMTPAQLEQIKETIPGAWAKIDDQTRGYLQTIIDSGKALNETTDALGEALTDLSFDSAKSELKDLLLSTDNTLADISDNFEKYMRNAIVNALIDGELSPLIKQWYVDFTKAMSDGVLTDQEKADLQNEYSKIGQTGISKRDQAFAAAGISPTGSDQNSTLSGGIKGVTEETASALSGNISAIRINMAKIIDDGRSSMSMLQKSLEYQLRTADNTEVMAKTLTDMNSRLTRFENDGIKVK